MNVQRIDITPAQSRIAALIVLAIGLTSASQIQAAVDKAADAAADELAPARLSFNDGTAEGKKSIAGAAEFLSFTLPNDGAKVAAIRVHGSRYGMPQPPKEEFSIYFLNQDLSQTVATKTAPYARFKRGPESWVVIMFPEPVEVPSDFWVGLDFHAEQKRGIYLSVDKSTDGSRSRVGQPGKTIRPANVGGDWMIEVVLAK